jgi:hypothetical protein
MAVRTISILCDECDRNTLVDTIVLESRKKVGLLLYCKHCGTELRRPTTPKRGATDSQKRSRKQEKRVAAREGGRRQPGSGSVEGFGGDVRVAGQYRGECKLTRAASYSLKLKDLMKLEQQASKNELPIFEIGFQGEVPQRNYVVMPEWVYETLMVESGRRPDGQ